MMTLAVQGLDKAERSCGVLWYLQAFQGGKAESPETPKALQVKRLIL